MIDISNIKTIKQLKIKKTPKLTLKKIFKYPKKPQNKKN
jgi:hypothetical protein